MRRIIFFFLIGSCTIRLLSAQDAATKIRINQVGFYPESHKIAVVAEDIDSDFSVVSVSTGEIVYRSKLTGPYKSSYSPNLTRIADFSPVTKPGTYKVSVPGHGESYQFEIKPKVFLGLTKALIKGFYFQRMSTPLLPEKVQPQLSTLLQLWPSLQEFLESLKRYFPVSQIHA